MMKRRKKKGEQQTNALNMNSPKIIKTVIQLTQLAHSIAQYSDTELFLSLLRLLPHSNALLISFKVVLLAPK